MNILLVDEFERSEFHQARESLAAGGNLLRAGGMAHAAAIVEEQPCPPELIVLAHAFPLQYSHAEIDRLRRLAPLSRIVALLGSWCEGETRSGSPAPGVIRVYWHQWAERSGRELARLARGEPSAWSLPVTATEEERLLSQSARPTGTGSFFGPFYRDLPARMTAEKCACPLPACESMRNHVEGLIAVESRCNEMADWLSAACRERGYCVARLDFSNRNETESETGQECDIEPDSSFGPCGNNAVRLEGAVAGVFDGSDASESELKRLRRFSAAIRPAPVVALLDFPRIEDTQIALRSGAAAMLSKPLLAEDLFWRLDRLRCAIKSA
jgi:hypothetical protein